MLTQKFNAAVGGNIQAHMQHIERSILNMSPESVLKRGYSITRLDGKAVKDLAQIKEGDLLETFVFKGRIQSIVKSSAKNDKL